MLNGMLTVPVMLQCMYACMCMYYLAHRFRGGSRDLQIERRDICCVTVECAKRLERFCLRIRRSLVKIRVKRITRTV